MTQLELAHLAFIFLWGGVVLAEIVMEGVALRRDELETPAKLHFWIDVLVELPLLALVLVTGALLVQRAWPLSPLLQAKVIAGLVAVSMNLYCMAVVVLRYRYRGDPFLARHYRKRVMLSGIG